MRDDEFEWDDRKAVENLARHGVSFEAARLAFDDTFSVSREDRRKNYGEDRYNLLGMVEGRLVHVSTHLGETWSVSSRPEEPNLMSNASTTKRTPKRRSKIDWSRFDAMTDDAGWFAIDYT